MYNHLSAPVLSSQNLHMLLRAKIEEHFLYLVSDTGLCGPLVNEAF
jgi:hypothetical protein